MIQLRILEAMTLQELIQLDRMVGQGEWTVHVHCLSGPGFYTIHHVKFHAK